MKSPQETSLQKQTPTNKCDSLCDRQKITFTHGKNILKKLNSKCFLLLLFTFFSVGMQAQYNENSDIWAEVEQLAKEVEDNGGTVEYFADWDAYVAEVNSDDNPYNNWEFRDFVDPDLDGTIRDFHIDKDTGIAYFEAYQYSQGWFPVEYGSTGSATDDATDHAIADDNADAATADDSGSTYDELYGDLFGTHEYEPEDIWGADDQYPPDDTLPSDYTNPIIVIVPDGANCRCIPKIVEVVALDVIPLDTSQYGYVDANNIVHIKSADGTYKLPSQLDPNSPADRRALNHIAASLARNLDGMNKDIVIVSSPGTDLSSKNPAFTTGSTITLNSNGGFSKDLDNANSFKSVLKHEILHVDDYRNGVSSNLSTHVDVYIKSFASISFKNTTDDFKESIINSLAQYILKMDKQPNTTYKISEIKEKIESFNLLHLNYQFFVSSGYNAIGGLTINIKDIRKYDNGTPIIYDPKITDEK